MFKRLDHTVRFKFIDSVKLGREDLMKAGKFPRFF